MAAIPVNQCPKIPGVFKSLPSVLAVLSNYAEDKPVKELLDIYNKNAETWQSIEKPREHKFIVFEGLDGSGKSLLTKLTASRLKGKCVVTPPKCISHLRAHFDSLEDQHLRRAFYSLGNYLAAGEVRALLRHNSVIMDRFWHSTAAYAIANQGELGDVPQSIYSWPSDLLKPDLAVFLTVSEDVRIERMSRRKNFTWEEDQLKANADYRNLLTETYRKMESPSLEFINCDGPAEDVVDEVVSLCSEN
ncbi:cytidine monophosphate (UMP-CMP) kinase 2, mitochondrial [Nesidiocoris tenuis]|uniref:Cytidine monophosphate (UMP-CMP) kinase 2, mitochondrial n=1 Tax=Nesidiocoris tenuis TaxID=355587 RepID=A0ABN7AXI1_9HEMI|nr:cytidine monophosphate (UMP-CMP) kinase 2, mitochondrial [Nesidiocoris tenuis]